MGPLGGSDVQVRRSGLHWLVEDGAPCRAGQIVGHCGIGPEAVGTQRDGPRLFEHEFVHVAFAAPVSGRLRHDRNASRGGFMDLLDTFQMWDPDDCVGVIETAADQPAPPPDTLPALTLTAGLRVSSLGGSRMPLRGWTSRERAWRLTDDAAPAATVLAMGICELFGVIKGEDFPFTDLLDAASRPVHAIYIPDTPLVPNARQIIDRIRRTAEQHDEIARDLAQTLAGGPITPHAQDWIFAGAMLGSLRDSPVTAHYDILTRQGLHVGGPPDAIVLSVNSEAPMVMRHKRLGYDFQAHFYQINQMGPAMMHWLRTNFEWERRGPDEIRADYAELVDVVRGHAPNAQILICNAMSTNGWEDIPSYDILDAPLGSSLNTARQKDVNLTLADLAREQDVAIVDADAIGAELGAQRCIPDGVHQNGEMQAEVRAEILHILRAKGLPGFAAA